MEEVEGLEDFAADGRDLALVHAGLGDDVGEAAPRQVLHRHPQLLVHQEGVQEVDLAIRIPMENFLQIIMIRKDEKYCLISRQINV